MYIREHHCHQPCPSSQTGENQELGLPVKMSCDKSVLDWTCDDVAKWLKNNNFSKYVELISKQHQIDGPALLTITENDLRQQPLQIQVLGDIKRLCICIRKLQEANIDAMRDLSIGQIEAVEMLTARHLQVAHASNGDHLLLEDLDNDAPDSHNQFYSGQLEPEYFKLIISYCYMFAVFLLTAFCMVIVHDRVPDMKKYPPLPDIVLDNIPYIPWAFEMCEVTGLILSIIWCVTLFFHKHRFILLRRTFSLLGSVFLLRCFTMLITSLSVPGIHLQCSPKGYLSSEYGDIWHKMHRALKIWQGFGMSLQGVRTCGDYMFSGHTVMVTLINFFITEYTPRKMYLLHTASWVMNIFAIFFILAAHEHYSIDVFIAFYISSRLFLYYHSLANNRVLRQRDSKRTRVWFPLFSFFESKVDGMVPNEFEWPLPWPNSFKAAFQKSPKKLKKR